MNPYYQTDDVTIYHGDCREVLPTLEAQSVQCCVTSPPYWGLRDYGTATWEGGDESCDHKDSRQESRNLNHSASEQRQGRTGDVGKLRDGVSGVVTRCSVCGANRIDAQLGLEPTPEEYVANMVAVFREVWRVLRDDGTLWLNLGDTYTRNPAKGGSGPKGKHEYIPDYSNARKAMADSSRIGSSDGNVGRANRPGSRAGGLREKNLVGIPWRVAFALQTDGWYLRQDIIWHKPNPMPESVTDRCTKAHEYIFLLSKSAKYHYDVDAIREPAESDSMRKGFRGGDGTRYVSGNSFDNSAHAVTGGGSMDGTGTRNKRSVWTVATHSFSGAHFATFPPKLIEPCILAGTSDHGCCSECGAPWKRVVERTAMETRTSEKGQAKKDAGLRTSTSGTMTKLPTSKTTGWEPTCECVFEETEASPVPCTVLDPFPRRRHHRHGRPEQRAAIHRMRTECRVHRNQQAAVAATEFVLRDKKAAIK